MLDNMQVQMESFRGERNEECTQGEGWKLFTGREYIFRGTAEDVAPHQTSIR